MVVTNNEVDKIGVNGDPRVNRKTAIINGKTYGAVALVCVCVQNIILTVVYRIPDRRARCWLHP